MVTAALVIVATFVAAALTGVLRRLAVRWGIVDQPGPRSVHKQAVPLLGGVALFFAFAITVLLHFGLSDPKMNGTLLGGWVILLLGTADDTVRFWGRHLPWVRDAEGRGLRPAVKLVVEVGAALILYFFGVQIGYVSHILGPMSFGPVASLLVTVFWVVAITNAMNLIDGLDGLTTGVTAIASLVLLIIALRTGQDETVALAACLLGSNLGFLPWNFYPARIFMGDGGALFLGFILASIAVIGPIKGPTVMSLAVPILALGLPVFDTFHAIVRRFREHRLVGQADRGHLHHRMLDWGFTHRGAVTVLYVMSGWLGVGALEVSQASWWVGSGILLFAVVSVFALARTLPVALHARPVAVQSGQLPAGPPSRRPGIGA